MSVRNENDIFLRNFVVFRPGSALLSSLKELLNVTNISQGLGTYEVVPVHVAMTYRNGGIAPFILSFRRD